MRKNNLGLGGMKSCGEWLRCVIIRRYKRIQQVFNEGFEKQENGYLIFRIGELKVLKIKSIFYNQIGGGGLLLGYCYVFSGRLRQEIFKGF